MATRIPPDYIPNKVRGFIDQLVFSSEEAKDALTAMLFVSHNREAFTTVPHLLVTAETPACGKTTMAADIPMLLAFSPWKCGKLTTRDALRNKYLERIRPNPVLDDVGKIFGDSGMNGRDNPVYALVIDCYREDGVVSVSRNGTTQDLPSYGMAFMNGLKNAVPKDLFTRTVWIQATEAPAGLDLRDALEDSVRADAEILKEAIHSFAGANGDAWTAFMRGPVRFIHPRLEKRKRQIWGPLFAFADTAGGDWPRRIYDAFVMLALDAAEKPVLLPEQRCLLATADIIMRRSLDRILMADLMTLLRAMPDGDYYRKAEDPHLVQRVFPEALGPPKRITTTALTGVHAGKRGQAKGWDAAPILKAAADLHDALYPPMERTEDKTELDLEFTPLALKGRHAA